MAPLNIHLQFYDRINRDFLNGTSFGVVIVRLRELLLSALTTFWYLTDFDELKTRLSARDVISSLRLP